MTHEGFPHHRRRVLVVFWASLVVLTAAACTGDDDDVGSPGAATESTDPWLAEVPEPPIVDKVTSNVSEDSFGGGVSASWAGSVTARDWPGSDPFLEQYDSMMVAAGFERGALDDEFPVAERTRRMVSYESAQFRVTVTITADDAVVGVVLDADAA